jgi:signal transduction histidine kinase
MIRTSSDETTTRPLPKPNCPLRKRGGHTVFDTYHIFTEGGKGEESQKVNPDSTGYGLYIVKGIALAHGGKVWFESPGPGKGTTFFMEVAGK